MYEITYMFNSSRDRIQDIINEQIEYSIETDKLDSDNEDIIFLAEENNINSTYGKRTEIRLQGKLSDEVYAIGRYFKFKNKNIILIEWIHLATEIQRNNLARIFRLDLLDQIGNNSVIYSKITNDKIISIVIDQGFRQIQQGKLKGWFVRE